MSEPSNDKKRSSGGHESQGNDKRLSQGSSGKGGDGDGTKAEALVRKRKDGTRNKMSFDVDELEVGLYKEVEDDEVEEYIEYEEIPDDELGAQEERKGSIKDKAPVEAKADETVGYKIRPDLSQKFRPGVVQQIIEKSIREQLEGKTFSAEECHEWIKSILEDVHEKVKSQNYRRYKLITNITLGERRGEGASSATRCLWDAEADCMATYTFLNDSMFCNGTVYGIYFY